MLARAPSDKQPHRELIIVSDFQRTNWTSVDFSVLPEDTRIQLEPVDPRETSFLICRALVFFMHPVLVAQHVNEDLETQARASVRFLLRAVTPRG